MKPYWFLWTIGIITFCSLLASNFVISFMEQLRREMGLKLETLEGLGTLGIKVMKEELML